MIRQFTIQPGRAANEAEVVRSLRSTGRYDSGTPRGSQARQLSPADLFEQYVDAKALGREKEFLKSLTSHQYDALVASIRKG